MREGSTIRYSIRAVGALLAFTLILQSGPALAAPKTSTATKTKMAEAARIQVQVEALDAKAEIATEDWNEAKIAYDELHAKVTKIEGDLARIDTRTTVLQDSLAVRADAMYRNGPLGFLDVLLGSASFQDFAATWDFLNQQNDLESRSVAELGTLRSQKVATEAELKPAQDAAKQVYDTMATRRREVLAAQAKARSLLKGVKKEVAALQAKDRARRAADAKKAKGSSKGTGWNWGDPARQPRSGVVSIALKYLGRPYVWAASGPHSFDCSGFTMFVYAQVGVHLPHSSRMQINYGAHVSRANLEPGDLMFFYNPIHHVAIYLGNGKMVHAPHRGDVVSIDPVYWEYFVGGCRP
jgi:cell wall-associated NlpC family hydrolase